VLNFSFNVLIYKGIQVMVEDEDAMKYLSQFMIILFMYFLGIVLQTLMNLPIPGTVLGLIILFLSLQTKLIKVEMLEEVSEFLLAHMAFLFVPAGVGLMTALNVLSGKWLQFLIFIIITTTIVWVVTAYVVKLLRRVML
jgi:holin-like protein